MQSDGRETPDTIDVQKDADLVRLDFGFDDPKRAIQVHLTKTQAALQMARMQATIEQGSLTPISASLLRPGQVYHPLGGSWTLQPDGSLLGTLVLEVEGRQVTFPFLLPPSAVADLLAEVGKGK